MFHRSWNSNDVRIHLWYFSDALMHLAPRSLDTTALAASWHRQRRGVGSVFVGSTRAPLSLGGGGEGFVLHVYVDACLIEVIANNRTLLSSQVLTTDASYDGVAVFGDVPPQAVDVWKLASIWR